jgi:hypothetical protein
VLFNSEVSLLTFCLDDQTTGRKYFKSGAFQVFSYFGLKGSIYYQKHFVLVLMPLNVAFSHY